KPRNSTPSSCPSASTMGFPCPEAASIRMGLVRRADLRAGEARTSPTADSGRRPPPCLALEGRNTIYESCAVPDPNPHLVHDLRPRDLRFWDDALSCICLVDLVCNGYGQAGGL